MSVSPVLPLRDTLSTASSRAHDRTIQECLPLLTGLTPACPALDRPRHIAFLHKSLRTLPAPYVAADAARPWMLYWAMAGRVTLGDGIDDDDRARLVNTVRPMQNSTGGFGGGHGQMSHLATTYAILLAVTTAGAHEALQYIDRRSMWLWLSQLKMADGGFQMSRGGEEDIR